MYRKRHARQLELLNSDDDIYVFLESQCNSNGSDILLSNFKN